MIPPGLHIRMNMQTGKKEAKLMDGGNSSAGGYNNDLVFVFDVYCKNKKKISLINSKNKSILKYLT